WRWPPPPCSPTPCSAGTGPTAPPNRPRPLRKPPPAAARLPPAAAAPDHPGRRAGVFPPAHGRPARRLTPDRCRIIRPFDTAGPAGVTTRARPPPRPTIPLPRRSTMSSTRRPCAPLRLEPLEDRTVPAGPEVLDPNL